VPVLLRPLLPHRRESQVRGHRVQGRRSRSRATARRAALEAVAASRTIEAEEDGPARAVVGCSGLDHGRSAGGRGRAGRASQRRARWRPRRGAAQRRRLDLPATDPGRYRWERVSPSDSDAMSPTLKLLHVLAERVRWRDAVTEARRRADEADALERAA